MTSHLCLLIWLILSICAKGDTKSEGSKMVGAPCSPSSKCEGTNMACSNVTRTCVCQTGFPIVVKLPTQTLCLKPAKLEEQCYHDESCLSVDENSRCLQVQQKALCGCKFEYHKVMDKNAGIYKCVPITQLTSGDLATFIGVGVGMTLFCGLTCLVLRIFARARFGTRRHHYANAHLAPPITLSADAGEGGNSNSRQSSQRSSIGGSRRQSLLAPPSRPGESRRASSSSIRSCSSGRSYSLKNSNHHRPSDPETHLNPLSISGNISPSRNQQSPHKGSRSSSTGAIGVPLS